jgi:tetratricopeptide (TPR) repeat protein
MKQQRFKPKTLMQNGAFVFQKIVKELSRIGELNKDGKQAEAWEAAKKLYAKFPDDPNANFVIALMLSDNDQKADALECAEAAVKFAPNNVRNLVFLGKLYVDLGMIEHAPTVLHKAFALDNTVYQAPWALALYYLQSGQGNKALPYFDMALQAAYFEAKPEIRSQRADCLRDVGQIQEAEIEYGILSDHPRYQITCLSEAALLRKNDQNSDYGKKVRNLLEEPRLTDQERSSLYLCLGRLFENGRDYENAFLNFEKSRNLVKSKFNPSVHLSLMDDNLATFKSDVFEKFQGFGHLSSKPIFVIGMPRSGTTMTEQIIASHSLAEGVGELDRMDRMAIGFCENNGMQFIVDKMSEIGPIQWKQVCMQYLTLINALAPNATRTVDKMPHNFICLGFIHLCFPNAKIIHCKRNPLDNFISAYQNNMSASHGYSYDQVAYGEYYAKYLQLMDHWKQVFPAHIYESNYESLTSNPEVEARKMLDFLGLPWEEACLKFNERQTTVRTFSQVQIRNPINTASVARWRNYEKHLKQIRSVLDRAGIQY